MSSATHEEYLACAESIEVVRARFGLLRQEMGQVSRQIGAERAAGRATDQLVAQMKIMSAERKRLEAALKAHRAPADTPATREEALAESPNGQRSVIGQSNPAYPRPDLGSGAVSVGAEDSVGEEWDDYVRSHPRATPYHLVCWRRIIEAGFGHRATYLAAREEHGKLAGVLPAFQQSSKLFGRFLTSLPFVNYGGALGDSPAVEECLMRRASDLALAAGCSHAEFRDDISRGGWPARTEKVSLRLSLPDASEALWKSFPSKVRAQVRRARREQPDFAVGGAELLGEFYAVFSRNMRDLGTPTYAPEFFHHILRLAGPECRVAVLRAGGTPVSGGILVGFQDHLEIPWASTLKQANPLGLNMLFYWSVLQYAMSKGYRAFDFGRSTRDAGTYRFKRQWGAIPIPLYWHYGLAEAGELPRLNPQNPKYRLAVAGWRRLPLPIANRLGPWLARNLP